MGTLDNVIYDDSYCCLLISDVNYFALLLLGVIKYGKAGVIPYTAGVANDQECCMNATANKQTYYFKFLTLIYTIYERI